MNLKDDALRGDRVTMFAQLAGLSRHEALGRLALLWDHCVKKELVDAIDDRYIHAFLGVPCAVLVDAQLAERVGDGARIRGVKEEVERKRQRSEHARRAGIASAVVRRSDGDNLGATPPDLQSTSQSPQLGANPGDTPSQLRVNSESTHNSLSDLFPDSGSLISEASSSSEIPRDLKQQRKGQRKKPNVQMPEGFAPGDWHRSYARENGIDLDLEFRKFVDRNQAKGEVYADWSAALRTWLRYAVERKNGSGRGGGGGGSSPANGGIRSIPNL